MCVLAVTRLGPDAAARVEAPHAKTRA
jgi:hypothetical protein